MARNLLMLALCFFVLVSMGIVLTWFPRRLKQIEHQRWGNVPDREGITASLSRFKTRIAKRRAAKNG